MHNFAPASVCTRLCMAVYNPAIKPTTCTQADSTTHSAWVYIGTNAPFVLALTTQACTAINHISNLLNKTYTPFTQVLLPKTTNSKERYL